MGRLWDLLQKINKLAEQKNQNPALVRGRIALKTGTPLSFNDKTPDDPVLEQKIINAAKDVLGVSSI